LPASVAAFASASVSGAAAAKDAKAVATALARTAELTVDLMDMVLDLRFGGRRALPGAP